MKKKIRLYMQDRAIEMLNWVKLNIIIDMIVKWK